MDPIKLKDYVDVPGPKIAYARIDAEYTLPDTKEVVSVRHGDYAQYVEGENGVTVYHKNFTLHLDKGLFEERYKRRDDKI